MIILIYLDGGQINNPSLGLHYFLSILLATPLSPSRTLEGLYELRLQGPWTHLVRCFRNYRVTRAPSGAPS